MKKKVMLHTSAILTAALLAVTTCACGAKDSSSGQTAETGESAGIEAETAEDAADDPNAPEKSDTNVTSEDSDANSDTDVTNNPSEATENASSKITVTFQENLDEIKADDGTVILTSSAQMPVVSIEGAEDIAEKINADISAYYESFSIDETLSMAKEDYAASLGEDGWDFFGYASDISAKVRRMDDAVISFELISYAYAGGTHGSYGSIGRNYDTKTGELITFDEISEDYEAFHATVLDYMINLAETPAYQDKLFENPSQTDLDSALFRPESWVFTLSGISFLIDPYILGPYASGEIYFMLPYEKAYDLGLKEDYRYNGNFVEEHYFIYKYDSKTFEPIIDEIPGCYFDLDGDGTEEGLAFYGYYVDPVTAEGRYAFYIDGKDYGEVIKDELQNIADNGYMETTYALYHADAPNGGVPAIAVLFTEFGDGENSDGGRVSYPRSYIFGYTKEKGLYYMYWDEGYVTLPAQP